jgi:hypothetical protein
MNPLIKEVTHDIAQLKGVDEIEAKIEELTEKLAYYTDYHKKKKDDPINKDYSGKFSPWARVYYKSLPGMIDGLKQTLILEKLKGAYQKDKVLKLMEKSMLEGIKIGGELELPEDKSEQSPDSFLGQLKTTAVKLRVRELLEKKKDDDKRD